MARFHRDDGFSAGINKQSPTFQVNKDGSCRIDGTLNVTGNATWSNVDLQILEADGDVIHDIQNSGAVVFNEQGSDIDFRIESDNQATMFAVDGGLDAIGIGAAGTLDRMVHIARQTRTATAATNYADLFIEPDGAVTIPTGTTAIVAAVHVTEPNITATGTVTEAATVYIAGAPTEGTDNFALLVDGGDVNLAGGAILAQSATTGFTFIPRLNTGAPSGTPAGIQAGNVAMCYDITNNALEIYNGSGWRTIATV